MLNKKRPLTLIFENHKDGKKGTAGSEVRHRVDIFFLFLRDGRIEMEISSRVEVRKFYCAARGH